MQKKHQLNIVELTIFNIHILIETLNKMGTGGIYLNTLRVRYNKPIAHIILNGEKLKTIYLLGTGQKYPLLSLLFNIVLKVLHRHHLERISWSMLLIQKSKRTYNTWKQHSLNFKELISVLAELWFLQSAESSNQVK